MYGIAHLVATGGIEPAGHGESSFRSYQEPTRPFEDYLIAAQPKGPDDRNALPMVRERVSHERRVPPGSESTVDERTRRDAVGRNEERNRARNDAAEARISRSRADSGRELEKKETTETRLSKRKTDDLKKPVAVRENDGDENGNAAVIDAAAVIQDAKDAIRNSAARRATETGTTEADGIRESRAVDRDDNVDGEHGQTGKDRQVGKEGDAGQTGRTGRTENRKAIKTSSEADETDGRLSKRSDSGSGNSKAARRQSQPDIRRGGSEEPSPLTARENRADAESGAGAASGDEATDEHNGIRDAVQDAQNALVKTGSVSRGDGARGAAAGEARAVTTGRHDARKRTVTVGDRLESENEKDSIALQARRGRAVSGSQRGEQGDTRNGGSNDNDQIVREITVDLLDEADSAPEDNSQHGFRDLLTRLEGGPTGADHRAGATPMTDAAQQLARRLNGTLGDSIVRQAQVILKDADAGEIRLIIRPPELGRVRIQLQMEQGHIAGRILVDNQNVRQAIEQNLAALQRAFAEAGLEMGELEVETGDARNQSGDNGSGPGDSERSHGSGRRAETFGRSVKVPLEYDYGNRHVNLVA